MIELIARSEFNLSSPKGFALDMKRELVLLTPDL
jgi:hypothetical protein